MPTGRVAATILFAVLACASPAAAATVETTEPFCPKGCFELGAVLFTAGEGERNELVVTSGEGGAIRLHDAGAAVTTSSSRCRQVDERTVDCSAPGLPLVLMLGDGDDSANVRLPVPVTVRGGAGNDRLALERPGDLALLDGEDGDDVLLAPGGRASLAGGAGDDQLVAGPGDDQLDGGEGADRLDAGAGDDRLAPGAGSDTVDGGAGRDLLSAQNATGPLVADLTTGTGEDASLSGIEDLQGSAFDDHLTGGPGSGRVLGGAGDDVLDGGAGDDEVDGEAGADTLAGGPGRDLLDGGRGTDVVTCGTGRDRALIAGSDHLPGARGTDCETVAWDKPNSQFLCLAPHSAVRARGRLRLRNPCPYNSDRWRVSLWDADLRRLGTGRWTSSRRRVEFRLTRRGRAAFVRGATVEVRVMGVSARRRDGDPRRHPLIALAL